MKKITYHMPNVKIIQLKEEKPIASSKGLELEDTPSDESPDRSPHQLWRDRQ